VTSQIVFTSVDAHDSYAQSVWWAQVLGWAEKPDDPNLPEHEECLILSPDSAQQLLFIRVPDDKVVTLADPEGNEFCVLSHRGATAT
jgi:hypothetical protein